MARDLRAVQADRAGDTLGDLSAVSHDGDLHLHLQPSGKIESGDGSPYPIFLYVGLLIWQYFSGTLTNASNSMVVNANMIQKVYFPRLIIPASTAVTGLVDLAFASVVLIGMMIYYGYYPYLAGVLILPLLLGIAVLASLGVGLFLASLNIKYRDVRYALPFIIQIMMYVSPVIYPVSMLDNHPGHQEPDALVESDLRGHLQRSGRPVGNGAVGLARFGHFRIVEHRVLHFGLYYFRATERYFADII